MENVETGMSAGVVLPVAKSIEGPSTKSVMDQGAVSFFEGMTLVPAPFEASNGSMEAQRLDEVREELDMIVLLEDEMAQDDVEAGETEMIVDGDSEDLEEAITKDEDEIEDIEGEDAELLVYESKFEELGAMLSEIKQGMDRIEKSSITKEDLLATILAMSALLMKQKKGEESMSLLEILIKAIGRIMIEIAPGGEDVSIEPVRKTGTGKSPIEIDMIKALLKKGKSGHAPVENKAA